MIFKVKFNLKSNFSPFQVCLWNNSSPIQATITKFGPEMQNTSFGIPIVLGLINLDFQGQM